MAFTLYIAPRQSDKTRTSISWLMGDIENRVIVAYTELERRRIIKLIAALTDTAEQLWEKRVTTFQRPETLLGRNMLEVCIDNLDLAIMHMFGPNVVSAVTMTLENVIEPDSAKQIDSSTESPNESLS